MENKKLKKFMVNKIIMKSICIISEIKKKLVFFVEFVKQNVELFNKKKKKGNVSLEQILFFGLSLIIEKDIESLWKRLFSLLDC